MPRKGQKMNPFSTAAGSVTKEFGPDGWLDQDDFLKELEERLDRALASELDENEDSAEYDEENQD